jgi:hypothetical protein
VPSKPRPQTVTMAMLRKAAPKGKGVDEKRYENAFGWEWCVQIGEGGFIPVVQTCYKDKQTARRAALAALLALRAPAREGVKKEAPRC